MTELPAFRLEWVWRDEPATGSPEERATRADLRMSVGAEDLTRNEDPRTRVLAEHVTTALYPLAEWVAFNWWSLNADARPGTQISQLRFAYRNGVGDARGAWWMRSRRHVLRAACDGFHWPDVIFVPEGRETRVVWMPDATSATRERTRFVARGNAVVESAGFVVALRGFVDAVTERLAARGITGTPLQTEWDAIRRAGEEETAFCLAAARLGLDPYSEAGPHREAIAEVLKQLPEPLATDFLNGVGAEHVTDRLGWLAEARGLVGPARDDASAEVAELRAACADLRERFFAPGATDNPWEIGYQVADRVREWAGLRPTEPFDPAPLMHYETLPTAYLDRGLVALGARRGQRGPTLVAARRFTARPRRFLQARALWHLICDVHEEFLIAAAHTHRQHVARGFALEVLAPAQGIAALLADPAHLVSAEDVEVIADDYGVGNIVVEHQLDNRVLAQNFEWTPPAAGVR
ncbi:hypothetical protein [Saccharopolyspora rosea]|uniref:Uncharacterized protein n=1 Tax=Saccharopolyspora rosea TaxID=524884 RepID=A0ABW3FZQ0_9PSEU|nr:hypothetical protein [Saccharopolyspora rosea]